MSPKAAYIEDRKDLQKLMRHKSYTTTLGYINLASQLEEAVAKMPIPKILQTEPKPEKSEEPSE